MQCPDTHAPESRQGRRICSWCRTEMRQAAEPGAFARASYGMCRRRLSLNLRRLDVMRGPAPEPIRSGP